MSERIGPRYRIRKQQRDQGDVRGARELLRSVPLEHWTSDHVEEAKHNSGWNYVAIMPIARLAARASVKVYDDGGYADTSFKRQKRFDLRNQRDIFATKSFSEVDDANLLEPTHPAYRLLYSPNKRESGSAARWQHIQQLHIHGVSLMFNCPTVGGNKIAERFIVPVSATQPLMPGEYGEELCPNGGVRVYARGRSLLRLTNWIAGFGRLGLVGGIIIPAEYLSVYKFPNIASQADGTSPTSAIGPWIDLSEEIDRVRKEHVRQGPQPKIILTPPDDAMQSDSALKDWERKASAKLAANNSLIAAIANKGAIPLGFTSEEMGYSDSFDQLGPATLAAHGTTKTAAGLSDGMTYGSLGAGLNAFSSITVQGDLDIIADEDTRTFATEYGEGLTIEYIAPTFNDPELQETQLSHDLQAKAMTKKEWRQKRGLQPFGDYRDDQIVGTDETGPEGQQPSAIPGELGAKLKIPGLTPPDPNKDDGEQKPAPNAQKQAEAKAEPKKPSKGVVGLDLEGTLMANAKGWSPIVKRLRRAGAEVVVIAGDETYAQEFLEKSGIRVDGINDRETDLIFSDANPLSARTFLQKSLGEVVEPERPSFGYLGCRVTAAVERWHEDLRSGLIASDVLEWETHPHITLLYGLVGVSFSEVYDVVSKLRPIPVTAGRLCWFAADDNRDSDVLYAEVVSAELREARKQLESRLPWLDSYGTFTPHMTVAYMLPGTAEIAATRNVRDVSFVVSQVEYQAPDREDSLVIPLRGV